MSIDSNGSQITRERARSPHSDTVSERSDAAAPTVDRLQNPRRHWLVTIMAIDLLALATDWMLLDNNGLQVAMMLRVGVVTPLLLLAIALNRRSRHPALIDLSNAVGTFAFVVAATAIGQWAPEPSASRYMMAALFIIFSATIFAVLPLLHTRLLLAISMLAYGGIVATGLRWPPSWNNTDLIGLGVVLALVSLNIRRERDKRITDLRRMRAVDAERTIELHQANTRLAALSTIDPLTGIFNRRYLDEAIERCGFPLAPSRGSGVLMIDVDNFKRFNDRAGHAGGDRCLRLIAGALQAALRSSDDIVARYGGEEFAVILPDADRTETLAVAERLRRAVAELAIPHPDFCDGAIVTVSVGAYVASSGESALEAIECADQRLYVAKQAGRNRVFA
ncbi:diguanylate cyclase (GGDEF)-like protein [Rhodopseudomonas rhenobacensis]|uniref:diguanylate cyclase n=2 Tax=Rhodopseudomonas rhenobacensis TaxID=87461 RepID=A0A7W8DZU8_9BRAD|nr:diguanylate cyclase (GGDEF)-like protein [Rhodopseudomonas rhenobacensis]